MEASRVSVQPLGSKEVSAATPVELAGKVNNIDATPEGGLL